MSGSAGNPSPSTPVRCRSQFDAAQSGFPTRIRFDANGDGTVRRHEPAWDAIVAEVTDAEGRRYTEPRAGRQIEIEESGPVRIVVKVTGRHQGEAATRLFAYTNRFTFYAGSPLVRLQYTWGNDSESPPSPASNRSRCASLGRNAAALDRPAWTASTC